MPSHVFFAVIAAALLHAIWNGMVKNNGDKDVGMVAIVIGHMIAGIGVLVFYDPVLPPESWPYLAAGIALHLGYQIFLLLSYKNGDLTQVYPIARGSAPMLVAGVSVVFLGVHLNSLEITAVLIIGLGILSLSLVRQSDGVRNSKAAVFAFITGCFIAGYSLIDGLGARIAENPLGFFSWLSVINAILFGFFATIRRRDTLLDVAHHGKQIMFVGGGASFLAYALVIWAFTQAPIALVTALRETSIIFALLIGVFFLKERINLAKIFSTFVTLGGAIILKLAR